MRSVSHIIVEDVVNDAGFTASVTCCGRRLFEFNFVISVFVLSLNLSPLFQKGYMGM